MAGKNAPTPEQELREVTRAIDEIYARQLAADKQHAGDLARVHNGKLPPGEYLERTRAYSRENNGRAQDLSRYLKLRTRLERQIGR